MGNFKLSFNKLESDKGRQPGYFRRHNDIVSFNPNGASYQNRKKHFSSLPYLNNNKTKIQLPGYHSINNKQLKTSMDK